MGQSSPFYTTDELSENNSNKMTSSSEIVIDELNINLVQSKFRCIISELAVQKIKDVFWDIVKEECNRCIIDHPSQLQHPCLYGVDENVENLFVLSINRLEALKMTGIQLELLTDIDQHLFIQSGIRGEVSTICHRYAKANVPGLNGYDESKPTEHLIYWDANNLYSWAMSQFLPTGDFNRLSEENIAEICIENIENENDVEYILEVDLGKFKI